MTHFVPACAAPSLAGGGPLYAPWDRQSSARIRVAVRAHVRRISSGVLAGSPTSQEDCLQLVNALARWLTESRLAVLCALHDNDGREGVRSHVVAVAVLMMNLAHEMGLPDDEVLTLGVAGLLHDIGKMTVPAAILDKPGRLDPQELARLRAHADDGVALLRRCGIVAPVILDVCAQHHERLDGRGYPLGLAGCAIRTEARMAALCDVYDALISSRSYKAPWSPACALDELGASSGYDQALLVTFAQSLRGVHLDIVPGIGVRL